MVPLKANRSLCSARKRADSTVVVANINDWRDYGSFSGLLQLVNTKTGERVTAGSLGSLADCHASEFRDL
jgi:mannose-1-phosphate guanylyltransferase